MDQLVKLKTEIDRLTNNEEEDLIDMYYELTINFDLKLITNKMLQSQKLYFLKECGLSNEEIQFYDQFDNKNPINNINYLIKLSEYDAIKARVFKFLFNRLRKKQVESLFPIEDLTKN